MRVIRTDRQIVREPGSRRQEWTFHADGRLTLASATPFVTSSQTGKSTVYFTPYNGNRISLYDTVNRLWQPRTFSEVSVAVPSTLFRLFDLYAYWNNSTVAIETTNWNQSTASATAATAAAPSVITSAGHGLSNNDLVGLASFNNTVGTDATNGLNGTVWPVANVTADTFEANGSNTAGLAASTSGTWYKIPNTRATALTTQDGRYVKTGDLSRLYLGTGMTTGTSGQCETSFGGIDSTPVWLLWNYFNRSEVELRYGDSTDTYTYSTFTWRAVNNRGKRARAGFVVGVVEDQIEGDCLHMADNDGANAPETGIDYDSFSTPDGFKMTREGSIAPVTLQGWLRQYPSVGFHLAAWLELAGGAGTTTWSGDIGDPANIQSGLTLRLRA